MGLSVHLNAPHGHEIPRSLLHRGVRAVLEGEGIDAGEVSVTFLPDGPMQALNRRWRGHDWVPDVLSFALHGPGDPPVGDVYVAMGQAARQAREHGLPVREELLRLTVHGTLHVLGHDHPEAAAARAGSPYYRKQEAFVRRVLASGSRDASRGSAGG